MVAVIMTLIRRALVAVGLLTVALLAVGLFVMFRHKAIAAHNVLRITLDGPLPEAPAAQVAQLLGKDDSVPLATLTARIRAAAQDKRIDGILLQIKSPEVGLAQIEELSRAMKGFRASHKWSASFLETAGEGGRGDGAFALATLANHVILTPPGEVNLTGLRQEVPFGKGALEKLHVQAHVEQRYEYKSYAEMFSERGFTPAHREATASLLDDMQARLSALMASNRQTDTAEVTRWVKAAPWSSADALAARLVDQVAYWDEVEEAAKKLTGRDEPFLEVADYVPKGPRRRHAIPVAMVVAQGEIDRGQGGHRPMGAQSRVGSDVYAKALRQAREDHVRSVLLRVDSPGGSYIASDLIRREVELTRDQNIPVVVSMGNVAASGGYLIAMDADHVVVEPGTITGSIGVVSVSFALREAMRTLLGVTWDSYAAVDAPGATNFLDPPEGEQLVRLRRDVDRIYGEFVTRVAHGRHKSWDDVHAVARGRVWTGQQAVARGLADELGGIDTAMAYLHRRLELGADDEIKLTFYPEPESPWQILRDLADGQLAATTALVTANAWLGPVVQAVGGISQRPGVRAQNAQVPAATLAN